MTLLQREINALKELRDQLKEEVKVEPIMMSQALGDLLKYVQENEGSDKLVTGQCVGKDPWSSSPKGDGCIIM